MIVKKHLTQDMRLILAICDDELLGKRIEEGKKQLDLGSEFYKGETESEEETIRLIEKACMINAAGKKAVECCLKAGIEEGAKAKEIGGIPYLQIVKF